MMDNFDLKNQTVLNKTRWIKIVIKKWNFNLIGVLNNMFLAIINFELVPNKYATYFNK